MRINPKSRSGGGRLWRPQVLGLMVVVAAIAAVVVSATGASSAKNTAKTAASSIQAHPKAMYGTLVSGTVPKNGTPASGGTIVA
jgi:hypothetical protein